jgi:hypothetical protein
MAVEVTEVHETRALAGYWQAVAGIVGLLAAIGLWNASTVSPDLGYDAIQHQEYAHLLIEEGRIPEMNVDTRALYDNPPGFYAVAGAAGKVGERLGMEDGDSAIQYLNVVFAVAAALLVLATARLIWPGRHLLQLGALAFASWLPLVTKAAAMFHPSTLGLLLAAAAVYLTAHMIVRNGYLTLAVPLGAVLVAGVIVMPHLLAVYAAVMLALAVAIVSGQGPRWRIVLAVVAVLAVGAAAAKPWLDRQAQTDVPALGNLPDLRSPLESRPAEFFTDLGLPESLTRPYRPAFVNLLVPTAYTDTWGDYFGSFAWNSSVDVQPKQGLEIELAAQSWIGLLPTVFALGGWLALVVLPFAHRATAASYALVVGLPAAALGGFVYYASGVITPDGDTLKPIFMLSAAPGWALAFGFAFDRVVRGRIRRPLLIAFGLIAVANLRFLVAGSPLGGLL